MSRNLVVGKRYAKALFMLAKERNQVGVVQSQLKDIVETMQDNHELDQFLNHPNIGVEKKIAVIKGVFPELTDSVFNTLRIMLDRQRQSDLPELYEAFVRISEEELGQATAVVTSAFPLDEMQNNELKTKFEQLTGKQITIVNKVDSNLLGGLRVRIGDRLYDGSIAGKLDRMKKTLKQSQAM